MSDKTLLWIKGPALGNDPLERGELFVGDKLLVLVECRTNAMGELCILGSGNTFWDSHVITCGEEGWHDAYGDHWFAWDWSDVSYYMKLDKNTLPPLTLSAVAFFSVTNNVFIVNPQGIPVPSKPFLVILG